MIFNRLRLRGKMNLLILLPLAALVFMAAPFITIEVHSAQSAATTADEARDAQAISNLIWQLQRERLLTAAFLASPTDSGANLRQQQQAGTAAAAAVQSTLGASMSDELSGALTRVGSLGELRDATLHRGTSLDGVARAYHAVIQALIDALRLVPQRTGDAEGTRELTALDALFNANEQSALRGMALIATAVNPQSGRPLMDDAASRAQQFIERFVEQADVNQADQVVQVELGEAGREVDAVATLVLEVHGPATLASFTEQALATVDAQAKLRRTVQDQVTGEIADAAGGRASAARDTAISVGVGTALLFVLVTALTVALGRSISQPLQRLTRAAADVVDLADAELARVGDDEETGPLQSTRLAAIEVTSDDEVGQLAQAFNQVQATAARLIERQVVSRHNVSMMFTNVAQRTRNLVGRQLAVVDDLERNEQNAPLLAKLYQLDHLATRLRRNAENLLVLAGSQEEARIKRPTPLATLLRAALTEIEDYQRVRFPAVADVVVGSVAASDLMLIFAELLENATTFSPPESTVEVYAEISPDGRGCQVTIVDHGIGMNFQRMTDENHRLVERERLDIAPTNVLGLFVVGRLSRRHGLQVRLRPTKGGGTTVDVGIPAMLFHRDVHISPNGGTFPTVRPIPMQRGSSEFTRYGPQARHVAVVDTPALVDTPVLVSTPALVDAPALVAAAVRALPASDGGFDWFARFEGSDAQPLPAPAPWPPPAMAPAGSGGGLARRVPGAHLAPEIRDRTPARTPAQPAGGPWQPRDPDNVQANFDSYTVAWRRAGNVAGRTSDSAEQSPMEGYQ
jgi:signal transduction histidine kinase